MRIYSKDRLMFLRKYKRLSGEKPLKITLQYIARMVVTVLQGDITLTEL